MEANTTGHHKLHQNSTHQHSCVVSYRIHNNIWTYLESACTAMMWHYDSLSTVTSHAPTYQQYGSVINLSITQKQVGDVNFLPVPCSTVQSSWWSCRSPSLVSAQRCRGRCSHTLWWPRGPWRVRSDGLLPSTSCCAASLTQSLSILPTTEWSSVHHGVTRSHVLNLNRRPTTTQQVQKNVHPVHMIWTNKQRHIWSSLYLLYKTYNKMILL